MRWQLSPPLVDQLKKLDVRLYKSFYQSIARFEKNPYDLHLNNHKLKDEYEGLRSINVTSDYRAIYEEIPSGEKEPIAYFFIFGTHKELYGRGT